MKSKLKKLSRIVGNVSDVGLRHITFNLKTSLVRNASMEGRDYKVAPMVMILEGVHNGSQGSLYYPANEIKKAVSLWDHKPVVVYHPTVNGQGVSACSPSVLTAQKVGVILNTRVDYKGPDKTARLIAEAWIEKDRASMIDKRVMNSLNNQKTMELSTGLFMDVQGVQNGEWNGEKYDAIARNYRPDHLALLPDKEGACSTKDGAGFIRNEGKDGDEEDPNIGDEQEDDLLPRDTTIEPDEEDDNDEDDPIDLGMMDNEANPDSHSKIALGSSNTLEEHIRGRGDKAHSGVVGLITKAGSFASRASNAQSSQMAAIYHTKAARTYDKAHIANYRAKGPVKTSILAAKAGTAHYDAATAHKAELTKNDSSHSDIRDSLQKALSASASPMESAYIQDVFPKFVVYSIGYGASAKTMKVSYTQDKNDNVTIGKDPVEVKRSTQYKTKDGKTVANLSTFAMPAQKKKKSGDSGAMGEDAMIASTVVGVTKANPTVAKKKKQISVNGGPGSGPQGGGATDLKAAYKEAVSKGDKQNAEKIAQQMWEKTNYQSSKNPFRNQKINLLSKNKTVSGAFAGNATSQPNQNSMKLNKKQQVDALIGNENSVWTEDEHDLLMSLNEKQVSGLYDEMTSNGASENNNGQIIGESSTDDEDSNATLDLGGSKTLKGKVKVKATTGIECENGKIPPQFLKGKKKPAPASDDEEDDTPAANESAEDYITNAPPEIREVLEEGLAVRNREKRAAIKTITSNAANEFSKEELTEMPLKQLRSLAKLAANSNVEEDASISTRSFNFGGQALVIENEETAKDEILALPTMNWSKDEIEASRGTKSRSA